LYNNNDFECHNFDFLCCGSDLLMHDFFFLYVAKKKSKFYQTKLHLRGEGVNPYILTI